MKLTWNKNPKKRSRVALPNILDVPSEKESPETKSQCLGDDLEVGENDGRVDLEAKKLADSFRAQGDKLAEEGRYEEALGKWEAALSIVPENAVIHEQKAQVFLEIGDPWKALMAATRATELDPSEPSTATMSNQKPKKRQRKESAKPPGDVVDVSRKQAKIAKTDGGRVDQSAASGPSLKKKISDSKTVQDSVSPLKPQSGNDLEYVKHSDKANLLRNALSPRSKAAESSGALHMKHSNKGAHQLSNSLPGKSGPDVLAKSTVVRQKENTDNATLSRQSIQRKGGSNARPKTSTLEKAFRELEKVVAESRPPAAATENQDADTSSSQAVKRRLPGDVKSKLAKVARIAASQGNVSGELINRLMSIVGHLIQVRSLKVQRLVI
ncbi:hypothetical protein F2Q68_00045428 [Brassica cretica]|uniref:Uncharacterized protein n=1 Tax=Brassica cretica TaxID=69181 RepID=A0A8S9LU51_BRACR|nr:hypothetical protein F2Q68_00045428 [Brassica cretica]